jgi:hypothetical protein
MGFGAHVWRVHGDGKTHSPNKNKQLTKLQIPGERVCCIVCHKEYSTKGLGTHIWRTHGEGAEHKPHRNVIQAWNSGLTKFTDERVRRGSQSVSVSMKAKVNQGWRPTGPGAEARKRLSISQTLHNRGGRCKWFDVDGQKVQGTWERDLAEHMSTIGLRWQKPSSEHIMRYVDDHKRKRRYTPDFYLSTLNVFMELKGFWWGNDRRKMELVMNVYSDVKIIIVERPQFVSLCDTRTIEQFTAVLLA